jgi:hypothetical protein
LYPGVGINLFLLKVKKFDSSGIIQKNFYQPLVLLTLPSKKITQQIISMNKFINVTLAKGSEDGLETDTPLTINAHYIIKVMKTSEDELGNASMALATGEFLFVTETVEDILRQIQ